MARIRTIKPEFFTSEDIVGLSPLARLLYIATWCEADKEGRLEWKPRTMKLRYFPADNCDIDALAAELVDADLIVLYGDGLGFIPGFSKHQHVNPRESASVLPEPDASARVGTRRDASARVNSRIDPQGGREGKGREGKGSKEEGAPSGATPVGGSKPKGAKLTFDGFVAACEAEGADLIPADDAVYAYAERIGLPDDYVALAWTWFARRYADKQQTGIRGWRQTFRNAVEGNWPKLWYRDEASNGWALTTAGKQAQLEASHAG